MDFNEKDNRREYLEYETMNGYMYEPEARKEKTKKSSPIKKFFVSAVAAVMLGSFASGSFYGTKMLFFDKKAPTAVETQNVMTVANKEPVVSDVSAMSKEALKSIVSITNVAVQQVPDFFSFFQGGGVEREVKMSGSGVILEKTKDYLYMITNHHVIDGAKDLSVTFSDDKTYKAEVVKYDENNDIAIIRVRIKDMSESTLAEIKPIKIGDSNSLEIGESVVAIGNALGYGQSVTTGVVSAVNRNFAPKESLDKKTYIQTDAAINPGNSGGALLNMKGELVGINTAKIASSSIEGMGYAIPMARVLELIKGTNIEEFQENALNL